MKKIGLMTWFTYDNFGSLLQCKGTIEVVKKLGYDIELINYSPKQAYSNINLINMSKRLLKKIINLPKKNRNIYIPKKDNYSKFRNRLPKSEKADEKSSLFLLNKKYDAFICGSDQIWAPTVFDENYFLSFVKNNDKKIAYAPSIGLPIISNKIIESKMKCLIEKFEYLSTREEQGANIIYKLTGKKAHVVLDPTLLLNKNEWSKEFTDIQYDKYILAYFLGDNKKYYKVCKQISEKLNKKLIIIPTSESDLLKKECILDDVGPNEFISLINKADLILTDSFHGTIFSINFNKPFVTFKRFKDNKLSQNSRIYNILEKLNLKSLLFNGNIDAVLKLSMSIDYNNVNNQLSKLRTDSIDFLSTALFHATNSIAEDKRQIITNDCTGCGMCTVVCPKQCIETMLNDKGFYEYKINQEECIHCNLCEKVCGQNRNKNILETFNRLNLYSGYVLNDEIRKESSSGGICTAIATDFIKNKKSVIGCEYDTNNNEAIFNIYTDFTKLKKMQGSKYIQANTKETLMKLKNIEEGVIFGTPCQISSIDLYLRKLKKRDKFLLVDFICHGVPTYYLWKKYISQYKNIKNVNFRDKQSGWRKKSISISTKEKNIIIQEDKDYFYKFFEMSNIYNECCYECKYRDISSADIRVGDYWGPRYIDNEEGVSMIIPITENGTKYFEYLNQNNIITSTETSMEDYYQYQQTTNIRIPLEYDSIIQELKNPNISLKSIDRKYNLKRRRINSIRKKIYKIWRR